MKDVIGFIWQEYVEYESLNEYLEADELEAAKRVFYAGFAACFSAVRTAREMPGGSEEELIRGIHKELEVYKAETESKEGTRPKQ